MSGVNAGGAKPSVCVVIPMYNAGATITTALASLTQQTQLPDHVIVVNDGSLDDGPALAASYPTPFPLTLINQSNQGQAAARNAGIRAAAETLICFLDADDVWRPNKLERQLELYLQMVAAGRRVGIIDCFELIRFSDGSTELVNRVKTGHHFQDFVLRNAINGTSCVMAPREILLAVGGFDVEIRYAEDRWLWTQLAASHEIYTVTEILSERFISGNNITANPAKYYGHKMRFIEKYLARFGAQLSYAERCAFVFENHFEFLRAFSRNHDYGYTRAAFENMLSYSSSALWFRQGRPLLRYLHAWLMMIFKPTPRAR